jgi:hypothetical protein
VGATVTVPCGRGLLAGLADALPLAVAPATPPTPPEGADPPELGATVGKGSGGGVGAGFGWRVCALLSR